MSYIVIYGSARSHGSTRKTLEKVFEGRDYDFVDIRTLNISHFNYSQDNDGDDFLPLLEKMVEYDSIVLVSPVYWYSVSSYMKTFLDRWNDLFTTRKDIALKLERKRLFMIASFAADTPLGCVGFETPIRQTCHYLNIIYGGCYYDYPDVDYVKSMNLPTLEEFRAKLFSNMDLEWRLQGSQISLRLATMKDRIPLYEWMYRSDCSASMSGPPLYPEKEMKTWEQFKASWSSFYFQAPLTSRGHVFVIEKEGVGIGGLAFHCPDAKNRSEIDIWMSSEKNCGHGYGSEALRLLTKYLYRELGISFFWLQPSARNPRSIRSYEKSLFKKLPLTAEEGKQEFGFQDYYDSVYMLRDMSLD